MLHATIPFLIYAALSVQSPGGIDTTIATGPATQLRLNASAGRLTVRVWDQSCVRIVATPVRGTVVRAELAANVVNISSVATAGRVDDADYQITVPRRMALTLGSGDIAMDIAGCEGEVIAKNYSGRIAVSGTRGTLSLKSVLGEVVVENAVGRVSVQAQNAPVRLTDVKGEVQVEGSANHLYLARVDSHRLTASTVSGVIWFSGPFHEDGHYSLSTHSGSVFLSVPEPVNATIQVSTVTGAFSSAFPAKREEGPRRGRFTVKVGTGAAAVDVETFNGGIVLKKPDGADET
jgi:DUF4097 and DUF4098 domain-containing protein YvlB